MKKYLLVLITVLVVMSAVGCSESDNEGSNVASAETSSEGQASLQQPSQSTYKDAEWAKNVTEITEVLVNDADDVSKAMDNSDWYTTFANIDTYKLDLSNAITISDSFTVSPELQPCKDEYRLGLIDDYNGVVLLKTSVNLLTSGDFASSSATADEVGVNFRSANRHYDNVTSLLESYNKDKQSAPLTLSTLYHDFEEDGQSTVNTPEQTTEPRMKTLADKEPEETEGDVSEDDTDTSESTASAESLTNNIFDYCTWQAETKQNIGEYYKAPENQIYVVVTIKIDNTGDQTYSTNGNYWHLKIGDMYYQYDTSTYDSSLNHMTTDVGPGGKITTKIAYLVDGNPSVSDLDLYYDGPGSDGVIYS